MAVDLSLLSNLQSKALGLSNLLLVNPQDDKGISAQVSPFSKKDKFLFSDTGYEGENTVTISSDITDHYIEDNTALQDNIAIKPVMITVQGFIGELNDIFPGDAGVAVNFLQNKLGVISAYTPKLAIAAQIAYNTALQLYQLAQNAATTVASWKSATQNNQKSATQNNQKSATQNNQQSAFLQFTGYHERRVLFTVQTPWAVFPNMAIQSLRAVQDAETRIVSTFEITFKQMQFATSNVDQVSNDGSRYFTQSNGTVTIGENTPSKSVASQDAVTSTYGAAQ